MKKILITFFVMIVLSGCSFPDYEGYVIDKEDGRILVVSSEAEGWNNNDDQKHYDALWASGVPKDIEIGEKVEVWADTVAESYPGQANPNKINVLPADKPEAADLTDAEAIKKALTEVENENGMPVVKSSEFQEADDVWIVEIVYANSQTPTRNVRIEDEK
ncbi:DUF3221 domain-containing protein [Salimicrobium halophilum]|uniref:DUF3221 domain-containing protein n=1 Tax=Salimicrobium halophilum TaxID=86666 RepID=A0A1G8QX25_9BACI|nr:DUF3221 domain-containing protein [Salimicrobium halophilum]SDJ09221.1 Protein of unknown function [Salimicrobium halophilum]